MTYTVNFNIKKAVTVSSFSAAVATVKATAAELSHTLRTPLPAKLFRSPKAAARINADRARSADRLAAGVKTPRTASEFEGSVGGLRFAVRR